MGAVRLLIQNSEERKKISKRVKHKNLMTIGQYSIKFNSNSSLNPIKHRTTKFLFWKKLIPFLFFLSFFSLKKLHFFHADFESKSAADDYRPKKTISRKTFQISFLLRSFLFNPISDFCRLGLVT